MEKKWRAVAAGLVLSLGGACSDDRGHVPPPAVESTVTTGIESGTTFSTLPDSSNNNERELPTTDAQKQLKDAFGSHEEPGALMDLTNGHFGELMDRVTSADLTPLEADAEGPGLIPLDDPGYAGIFSSRRNFRVSGTDYVIQDFNNAAGGHDRLIQIVQPETDENGRKVYSYRASLQIGPYGKGTGKVQKVASVAIPPLPGLVLTNAEYHAKTYNIDGLDDVRNAEGATGKNLSPDDWTNWVGRVDFPNANPIILTDFMRTNGDVNGPQGWYFQQVRLHVTDRTGMISNGIVLPTGATK